MVTLGLEPQRILILDGGYQESPLFDLHCYSIGGVDQRIWYFPRQENAKKPSAKKITKNETSVSVTREYQRHPVANPKESHMKISARFVLLILSGVLAQCYLSAQRAASPEQITGLG
jgi:hypothetical protein